MESYDDENGIYNALHMFILSAKRTRMCLTGGSWKREVPEVASTNFSSILFSFVLEIGLPVYGEQGAT